MNSIIRFFITKLNLNYTLFVFLFFLGILSYITIPKDVYPAIKIQKIHISGGYASSSIDILNKMVITKLEKELKSLNGVKKIESFIQTGAFDIILTLEDNANNTKVLDSCKDIISNNKVNSPSDMDKPIASLIDFTFPLINITISSNKLSKEKLIKIADEMKSKFSTIENISKVSLYEDTDKIFEIIIDDQKLNMYGLEKRLIFEAIRDLIYIYPIGKIENSDKHFLISTKNNNLEQSYFTNMLVKIGQISIYLEDILTVEKKFNDSNIISMFNAKENIELAILKNEKANSIKLVKELKSSIKEFNKKYPNIEIATIYDSSKLIKNRLNTIFSSIIFGLILIGISMSILINKRVAFVVVLGIPTTILIGVIFLDFAGHSINMMTLIGTLLILGVLVDDAIIIAENIQRHIQTNKDKLQATIDGTKEVMLPVFVSSLTTIFAFIPMFILTGEIGEFIKMIPVAIVVLIIASLLESFVFLPMHSLHILNSTDKELDWSKFNKLYTKILNYSIRFKKIFLFIFLFIIPFITFILLSQMNYQLFPDSDSNRFYIKGKFNPHHTVENTYEKTKNIEKKLLEIKDKYGVKSISYISGLRIDNQEQLEIKPNVFQFSIELHERVAQNFVEEFITPLLSIEKNDEPKVRVQSISEIILAFKKILEPLKHSDMEEFSIKKESDGIVNNDIEILISNTDKKRLHEVIKILKLELKDIDGVNFVDDSAKFGLSELKLELNNYGQQLGFTQVDIATLLSSSYLESMQTKALGEEGIIEIKTKSLEKDSLKAFKNYELSTPDGLHRIILSDICTFSYQKSYESIYKSDGVDVKIVFANVDKNTITPSEVLSKINPILKELKSEGTTIKLEGENAQNNQMMEEMSYAFFIAIFLIFITLLAMFDSYKYTLMLLSIIPLSTFGVVIGHLILDMNFTLTSVIGILGLAGVVINDGVIMLDFIRKAKNNKELVHLAKLRLRPIMITSVTTFLGLSALIFFATGQALILQPVAVSLGFGLLWGTILNLLYLPIIFAINNKIKFGKEVLI
jgi:HAE1 family hydrophobic/amphiphilic exporter-1